MTKISFYGTPWLCCLGVLSIWWLKQVTLWSESKSMITILGTLGMVIEKKKDDVVPVYSQSNGQIIWLVEFFCLLSFQNNFIKAFTFVFFISFSIYPSQEHDCNNSPTLVLSVNSNNTGSLPDLSVLQFPSPLATPLDQEDPYNNVNAGTPVSLSPTSPHHMPIGHQSPQSPSQRRRQTSGIPSPLVLNQIGGPSSPVSSHWTCLY